MAQMTAEVSGLTAEVLIDRGYPVLNNDAELTARTVGTLERAAGAGNVRETPPILACEDCGAFTHQRCIGFSTRRRTRTSPARRTTLRSSWSTRRR